MTGKKFIFLCGAEGSGTTLLLRLLSSPTCCASLGGKYIKVPAESSEADALANQFEEANRWFWDTSLSFSEHAHREREFRDCMKRIAESQTFAGQSHLFFKRSFPFGTERGKFTPDLWDIQKLCPSMQYVAIYREPCAACYSAFRRGFDNDLRRLAVACSSNLTWLSAQLDAMDSARVRIISYERMCEDPAAVLKPLAKFCGIDFDSLKPAIDAEAIDRSLNDRYRRELDASTLVELEQFFSKQRRRQWENLEASTRSARKPATHKPTRPKPTVHKSSKRKSR